MSVSVYNKFCERLANIISNNFSGLIYVDNSIYIEYLNRKDSINCTVFPLTNPNYKGTVLYLCPPDLVSQVLLSNIDELCSKYLLINWPVDRDYVLREFNGRGYKLLNDKTNKIRKALQGDDCYWLESSLYLFER